MKYILLIIQFLFTFYLQSQEIKQDTTKRYFSSGKPSSIYVKINGKNHGLCRQWFENGNLKFKGEFSNGLPIGMHFTYFDNGQIQYKTIYRKSVKYLSYYKNGKKSGKTFSNLPKIEASKSWFENGNLMYKSKHRYPGPGCIQNLYDTTDIKCSYNGKKVFLKNGKYVDSLDQPIKIKSFYIYKEYYPNGNIKTKTKIKKGNGYKRSFNENGKLIKEEKIKRHTTQV